MADSGQLAQDLQFVKAAVERQDSAGFKTPLSIPILWGVIVLAGCLFNDLDTVHCWIYWMSVPPIGYALSVMLGGRAVFMLGQYSQQDGIKQGLHWSSIFFSSVPIVLLAATGKINGWQVGQLMFLVSGLVWYLAGVHLDRRYLLPGLAMILSSIVLTWYIRFAWTAVGALICIAIIAGFAIPWRKHA